MAKTFPRPGAWTTIGDQVGIITALSGDEAEVHLVNKNGETETVATGVPVASLTQARLAQIPAARRPSKEIGAAHGYR